MLSISGPTADWRRQQIQKVILLTQKLQQIVNPYGRGGASGGLEETIVNCRNMRSPPGVGEKLFCRRLLAIIIP